jgi:hypothetical protein
MQISQYPKATDLVWKALPDSTYSVTFKSNGKPGFAHYGRNLVADESHAEIDSASLPRPIVQMIDSLYPGYKYKSVAHFATSMPIKYEEKFLKYTNDHYLVLIAKGTGSYKLYFTPDGRIINRPEMETIK